MEEEEVERKISLMEQKFQRLAEDFTQLRHEVNVLERKVEKRT